MKRRLATWAGFVLLSCGATAAPRAADGAAFTPGNLLVARERFSLGQPSVLHEYTPAGQVVQTITIGPREAVRGVVSDGRGRAHVYYGTFAPSLWTHDPVTGQSTSATLAGWSSAGG